MGIKLKLTSPIILILFLNSCAAPAVLTSVGGTLYGVHKTAKAHFPDQVPSLPEIPGLSNILNIPLDNKTFDSSALKIDEFGFDCTIEKNGEAKSKCFDRFTQMLSEKEKSQALIKPMTKEEELSFFNDVPVKQNTINHELAKKQLTLKNDPEKLKFAKIKTRPQETTLADNKPVMSHKLLSLYLLNWVKAWQKRDINAYISFYSEDFMGTKSSRLKWEEHRRNTITSNSNITIEVSNIHINQNNNIVNVNFTQHFKSDSFSDFGTKELVWAKNKHGWKIVQETWMPVQKPEGTKVTNLSEKFISSHLLNWVIAWNDQDINSYLAFYAKDFIGSKRNRVEWETHRNNALKNNSNMSIQVSNVQLSMHNDIIEINFVQKFKSDRYSDIGIKELVWKKTGTSWKILKETWIPS